MFSVVLQKQMKEIANLTQQTGSYASVFNLPQSLLWKEGLFLLA